MIKEDMKFIGYRAFYKVRYRIREHYKTLNKDEKLIYKYYVYSRRQLKEYTCDLIWSFLNDDECATDEILEIEYSRYRM